VPILEGVAESSEKTLSARRARVAERREAWRERDAERYRLAEELAAAEHPIRPEDGFALHAPGTFPRADEVVAAANELIDGIGHEGLVARSTKDSFMAQGLLTRDELSLGSPYMRFVLDEAVIAPIAAYLGVVPVLHLIDLWYSFHGLEAPKSSQRWHLDSGDTTQIKVWIHCSDVAAESGPLTVIDAATSEEFAERIGYDFGKGHRVPDEAVDDLGASAVTPLEGPAGTVHFVDTSRCFHFGSRVSEGGTPRRVFVAQYLTPYAFRFRPDHLQRAPYRELAHEGSSELERLVLGVS
jgi:hypothetical protein